MTSSHHVRRRNNNNNKDVSQLMLSVVVLAADGDNGINDDDVTTATASTTLRLTTRRRKRGGDRHQQPFLSSLSSSFFRPSRPHSRLSLLTDPCSTTNSSKMWIFIFLFMTTLQACVIIVILVWWPQTSTTSPVVTIFTKQALVQFTTNHFWISTPPAVAQEEASVQAMILHRRGDGNINTPTTLPRTAALLRFNRPLRQGPLVENQTLFLVGKRLKEPLDDYYSRPHIKVSLNSSTGTSRSSSSSGDSNNNSSSSSNNTEQNNHTEDSAIFKKLPVLIIGGSDGSGTRAFVDTLAKLGVPMLADDGGTFDVHAAGIMKGQGWPPLVQAVLRDTHQQAANYSINNDNGNDATLSEATRQLALTELDKLRQRFEIRALQLRKRGLSRNISLSQYVSYGFKAPVTMLLLPLLVQVFGKVKFVHVLRDGRDVALSDNGSPVIKFYNSYYGSEAEQRIAELLEQQWGGGEEHDKMVQNVQAMQLWNDWNVQVYEYCRQRNDGVHLDYLPMRTEDLLDESSKLASLIQLADFVGSMQTPKQLCCKSRLKIVDMGGSNEKMGRQRLSLRASGDSKRNNIQNHLGWWGQFLAMFSWGTSSSSSSSRPAAAAAVATFGSQHLSSEYQKRQHLDTEPIEDLNDEADIPMESVFLAQLKQPQQQQQPNGRLDHLANRIGGRRAARDGHAHHGWQHQRNMDTAIHAEEAAPSEKMHGRRLSGQQQERININSLLPPGLLPHHLEMSDAEAELFRNALEKKQEAMYRVTMVEETPAAEKNLRKDLLNRWDQNAETWQDPSLEDAVMAPHSRAHQHHHHRAGTADDVKKRYGKWVTALEGKPVFSALLHQQGARGLQLFGYEPNRIFADTNVPPQLGCPCDETVECSKEDATLLIAP